MNITINASERSLRESYVQNFNSGFDVGLAKFEDLVFLLFAAMLVNVLASRALKMVPEDWRYRRFLVFLENGSFSSAFTVVAFLTIQTFMPYIKV